MEYLNDAPLSEDFVRKLPKVLLHDHLDGGVRAQTVIDLAKQCGYDKLPSDNSAELNKWFQLGAQRGSLPLYLEGFAHTCAVMQTAEALERVAYEALEDMMLDGVLYLETRFAPLFHVNGGLTLDEVVEAVLRGLERGKAAFGVEYGVILAALRSNTKEESRHVAELAVRYRDRGVVGFDFAGAEKGYPAIQHLETCQYIIQQNFNTTIHAGEGYGIESIRQAIVYCGAHRIGHGTRITEDIVFSAEGEVVRLGTLSQYVLDRRIPLEMCLTSNVHTGTAAPLKECVISLYAGTICDRLSSACYRGQARQGTNFHHFHLNPSSDAQAQSLPLPLIPSNSCTTWTSASR